MNDDDLRKIRNFLKWKLYCFVLFINYLKRCNVYLMLQLISVAHNKQNIKRKNYFQVTGQKKQVRLMRVLCCHFASAKFIMLIDRILILLLYTHFLS